MRILIEEQIPPHKINNALEAPRSMLVRRHAKHLVQFLERQALGLGHEEQDQPKADDVPAGVPREGARGREGGVQLREGDTQDKIEEPRRGRREGHADRAHVERVGFCRVGERHGAFAWGVDDSELDASSVSGVRSLGKGGAELTR